MAKIIAGVGTSHIPTVGAVIDKGIMEGPYWDPFIQGIKPAREWFEKTNLTFV